MTLNSDDFSMIGIMLADEHGRVRFTFARASFDGLFASAGTGTCLRREADARLGTP